MGEKEKEKKEKKKEWRNKRLRPATRTPSIMIVSSSPPFSTVFLVHACQPLTKHSLLLTMSQCTLRTDSRREAERKKEKNKKGKMNSRTTRVQG